MEAIKTQISHPYNCSNHPAFHLSACGGRIPLPSPLFHSGQVSSKLLRICPISSLPLCLALWVLPSPLTSFLAAQTQQSPSNYCFPKVHILYHLRKFELLTWSIVVFPPFLFSVWILTLLLPGWTTWRQLLTPVSNSAPLTGAQATAHLTPQTFS